MTNPILDNQDQIITAMHLGWPSIPDPKLMAEIGKRVANTRTGNVEDPERTHVLADTPQPMRTDLETQVP